ncbi:hypothetical protein C823_003707 [Eubacterium plexicaudatum ASF492]|uniref:DUF2800 domain-containing protein n=1 Tax=Eubacterium plexicaudatum ASF492 TaxID=1235802 RepID=N2A628_9FIRM|nr:hypothetical protein C823_003707 [Eubacterium plexicaudatum ASF492]
MGIHALLSASSSHRWLACPPSARLCENYEDTGSEYAQQGTDAHSLCEHKLKLLLGMETADPTAELSFYDEEMEDCACGYAEYVLSLVEEAKKTCKDPVVLIEQKLDFSRFVKDGFGTGDCVIIADGTLYIIDYKHGKGVEISATENPQMMLYALGALELFDGIYDIDTVQMAIYQPRRENVSVCVMAKDDLLQWAYNDLMAKAKLAYDGEGEFNAGEYCRFCKAKAVCRKRAEYNLELARYDFEMPATLEDDEIAAILIKADELAAWAADVKEFALQQALSGVKYDGFKIVEGRSNRKYTDEGAVADTVKKAGYDPYEPKLLGITAMEKLLGRKKFAEILNGLVEKPQGKPALVPESDKRPPMNTAAEDFK